MFGLSSSSLVCRSPFSSAALCVRSSLASWLRRFGRSIYLKTVDSSRAARSRAVLRAAVVSRSHCPPHRTRPFLFNGSRSTFRSAIAPLSAVVRLALLFSLQSRFRFGSNFTRPSAVKYGRNGDITVTKKESGDEKRTGRRRKNLQIMQIRYKQDSSSI